MNRSNSFVTSLKWWPNGNSATNVAVAANGHTAATHNGGKSTTYGSSVAVQKLRETKWFRHDEQRIFCAVVECGFIVELRSEADENDNSWFGVVVCKTAKDSNKPKAETIEIVSIKTSKGGGFKLLRVTLEEIWKNNWIIRINNFSDKEKTPHCEKDIRDQIAFAKKVKQSLWHSSKHFAYWCRYGNRQQDIRRRQMSECVRWGSVGMNAGMLLVMSKQKSLSTSK